MRTRIVPSLVAVLAMVAVSCEFSSDSESRSQTGSVAAVTGASAADTTVQSSDDSTQTTDLPAADTTVQSSDDSTPRTNDISGAATEPDFAIENTIDWESEPFMGTFEVTIGADELGCSAGSVLETGARAIGITNEFTCEGGPRVGTFTIEWQIVDGMNGPGDRNGPWTVVEATGDFAGLTGEGLWSGTFDDSTGHGSFLGDITFDS